MIILSNSSFNICDYLLVYEIHTIDFLVVASNALLLFLVHYRWKRSLERALQMELIFRFALIKCCGNAYAAVSTGDDCNLSIKSFCD
ncbi:MAG: hypothetical protein WBF33_15900 [Candidatus Nitrosopolaris sp.]